jgi:choline dehydrogenase-like flavoprotein
MFHDARKLTDGQVVRADLCIVGGGPAGITIAKELADSSLDVCLLESGGPDEDDKVQTLARGESTGRPYYPLDQTRFRVLGGASGRWGGWCRPLDPIDLEPRPWVPHSGWPITWSELDPFLRDAARLCQLERGDFEPSQWNADIPRLYGPEVVGDGVVPTVWQGSPPTKFGVAYRDVLKRARNLAVYLYATAVELETDELAHQVTGVRVACLDGPRFRVEARAYVLAAGAMETARLLLASQAVRPAGLGNDRDLVGRYFMEHPHVVTGRVRLAPREASDRALFPAIDQALRGVYARVALQRPSGNIRVAYSLAPDVQRREGLLNFSAHLTTGDYAHREDSEAYGSLKLVVGNLRSPGRLAAQIRDRTLPAGLGKHVRNLVTNLDEVVKTVASEVLRRPTHFELFAQTEVSPNADSRLTLSDERDALGMPRLRLSWKLSPLDKRSIRRSQELLGSRLESAGIGTVEPEEWVLSDDDRWGRTLQGGHHHLGTARMSDDPATGVVDRDGRVHGIGNLFVADSAVFPTSGYANPMLTIVALALRMAGHLRGTLKRGS